MSPEFRRGATFQPARPIGVSPAGRASSTTAASEPDVARTLVLAVLDALVEGGFAAWRQQGPERVELSCSSGETWLLDSMGVTRLR